MSIKIIDLNDPTNKDYISNQKKELSELRDSFDRNEKTKISPNINVPSVEKQQQDIYHELIIKEKTAIETLRNLRKMKKNINHKNKNLQPLSKTLNKNQILSRIYKETAKDFLVVLRKMGISVLPKHIVNPIAIRQDSFPGDGRRQITANLYFPTHSASEPLTAKTPSQIPADSVLSADGAIGYTTVTLNFQAEDTPITIIGKTICSYNDDYNGNLGVVFALKNAFDQIEAREIKTPIRNLNNLLQNAQDLMTLTFTSGIN